MLVRHSFLLASSLITSLICHGVSPTPVAGQTSVQIFSSSDMQSSEGGEGGPVQMGFSFATPEMSFSFGGTPQDPTSPNGLIELLQNQARQMSAALDLGRWDAHGLVGVA